MGKQSGNQLPSLEELGLSKKSKLPSLDELGLGKQSEGSSTGLQNTSQNGKPTSLIGGGINPTFLPSTNTPTYTDTPSALTDKGKGEYVQDQIVKKEAILNNNLFDQKHGIKPNDISNTNTPIQNAIDTLPISNILGDVSKHNEIQLDNIGRPKVINQKIVPKTAGTKIEDIIKDNRSQYNNSKLDNIRNVKPFNEKIVPKTKGESIEDAISKTKEKYSTSKIDNIGNPKSYKEVDQFKQEKLPQIDVEAYSKSKYDKFATDKLSNGNKIIDPSLPIEGNTFADNIVDGAAFLSSEFLKGAKTLGVGLGAAAFPFDKDKVVDIANKVFDPFVNTEEQDKKFHNTPVMSQIGGFLTFAPQILASESTGGLSTLIGGFGEGTQEVARLKANGVKFDNGTDDIYIGTKGLINYFLLNKINAHSVVNMLPTVLKDGLLKKLSYNLISDLAKKGEEITGESILNAAKEHSFSFGNKLGKLGLSYVKSTALTAIDLSAFNVSNFALGKAINKVNDKEIFKQTPEELLQSTKGILGDAAVFSAFGTLGNAGQLFTNSPYRNTVIDQLYKDATPESLDKIKLDLQDHLERRNLSNQEIQNSLAFVDKLSEVTRTLPKTLSEPKFNKGVEIIVGKDDIKQRLNEIKDSKANLDESIKDIPTQEETMLNMLLDKSNDSLQELVTGDKYKYDFNKEKGTYTKQLGNNKPEEITEERYDLEQLEIHFNNEAKKETTLREIKQLESQAFEIKKLLYSESTKGNKVDELSDEKRTSLEEELKTINSQIKNKQNESTNENGQNEVQDGKLKDGQNDGQEVQVERGKQSGQQAGQSNDGKNVQEEVLNQEIGGKTYNYEKAPPIIEPSKPISEMNSEEMRSHFDEVNKALKAQDKEFANKSEKEKEDGGYYDVSDNRDELRDAAERINFIESSENINDLAKSFRSFMENKDIGKDFDEYGQAVIKAIKDKTQELGIGIDELIKTTSKIIHSKYKDVEDADFMVDNFIKKLNLNPEELQKEESKQLNQSNEKVNNEEPMLEGVQGNRVENKGEQGSSELRTEETGKEKIDALKLNDIKSKNKARANILVRELRDSEGNPLGEITIEHDGTPEDIQSSAAELNSLMESEYPNASNIQSRFLAFDENGEAKWTISPNLKKVAEINTKEGRDIAGIEESNDLKPQDNATKKGKIEQSSIGEYKGTIEQQQGGQENRNNKEKPISPTETKTSDSNSVEQSGEKQKVEPTKLETAKERLVKAREAKKAAGLGIANDPKQNAKLLFEEHSAMVDVAKEYIKEGIDNLKDFAKELGEKVSKSLTDAWNEANGGNKLKLNDFTPKTDAELIDAAIDNTIGITKADTAAQRKARGIQDVSVQDTKTLKQMFEDGKQAHISGEVNTRELAMQIMQKPRNLSYTEVNAFLYDRQVITAEKNELIKQKLLAVESGNLLDQHNILNRLAYLHESLHNNEYAVKAGARENALALTAMQNMIAEDYSLASQTSRMEAGMGGELTDAQHKELKGYMDELEAANLKLADFEKERTDKIAKDEVNKKVFEARKNKKVESKEVLKKEREVIVNDFLKELEKIRKTASSTLVPYTRELLASAPFIKKMLVNLTKEGIVEFKDVVDNIHTAFKEHIEGLSKEDVVDVLAGKYNEKKETTGTLIKERQNIRKMAELTAKLNGLLKGLMTAKSEKKIAVKRDEIRNLEIQIKGLEKELGLTPEQLTNENLKKRLAKINEKLQSGDYTVVEREKLNDLTPETIALKGKVRRAQNNFDTMSKKIDDYKEKEINKWLDTYSKVNRAMLLSGTTTLGKLYSFATLTSVVTPIEQVISGMNSKLPLLKRISAQSPRYSSGFNAKIEANAIATRWSMITLKDTYEVLKTGVGALDRLYGKNEVDKGFQGNTSAIEFFGRLHAAYKNSTKRAEFFRSYEYGLKHASKLGQDINDPNVQYVVALDAYANSKRAILMHDNMLNDAYKGFIRSFEYKKSWEGKTAATALRTIFPIVKIPTNYALTIFDYSTFGARSWIYIGQAAIKGAESLTPQQADMVMRTFSKGQFGLAMMTIAFFNPNMFGGYYSGKRDDKDLKAGDIVLMGETLPHFIHHPILDAMQLAATFRRAMDSSNGHGIGNGIMDELKTDVRDDISELAISKSNTKLKEPQQITLEYKGTPYIATVIDSKVTSIVKDNWEHKGFVIAAKGLSQQVPFFDTPSQIGKGFESDSKFTSLMGQAIKNRIEPRLLQELAGWQDRRDGEVIKRDPKTILENLKVGVPFLREQVAEKSPANSKLSKIEYRDKNYILNPEQTKQREVYIADWIKEHGVNITSIMKEHDETNKTIEDRINKLALDYSNNMMAQENMGDDGYPKLKEKSKYEK